MLSYSFSGCYSFLYHFNNFQHISDSFFQHISDFFLGFHLFLVPSYLITRMLYLLTFPPHMFGTRVVSLLHQGLFLPLGVHVPWLVETFLQHCFACFFCKPRLSCFRLLNSSFAIIISLFVTSNASRWCNACTCS